MWEFYVVTVATYVLLGVLFLWGAIAWNSLVLLILSGLWWYMAVLFVLWFIYTRKVDESNNGYPDP